MAKLNDDIEFEMKTLVQKHLELLGHRVEDRVTGFKEVVSTVGFDLYGCVQVVVNPGQGVNGKIMDRPMSSYSGQSETRNVKLISVLQDAKTKRNCMFAPLRRATTRCNRENHYHHDKKYWAEQNNVTATAVSS